MGTFDEFPSLRALLAAASAGNERAVNELCTLYNGIVCRYILSHLRRKGCHDPYGHRQDIISPAWFAILRYLYQLEDYERFEPWINKIISNLVFQHVSGPRGCITLQKKTEQFEATHEARIAPTENMIEANLWVKEVVKLAYEKSFMFGEIVRLHLVVGYTLEKVAAELGQTPGQVRNFYYRNLKDFRKTFSDNSDDDDGDDDGDSPYEH